ncbi:cytochrome P450 [Melanogaster broomeanus]|nr:cytochrome P450 [Melanogaster broomeanus]
MPEVTKFDIDNQKPWTPIFDNSAIRRLTPVFYDLDTRCSTDNPGAEHSPKATLTATGAGDSSVGSSGGDSTVIEVQNCRWRPKTTRLRGPPSPSVVFGFAKDLLESPDAGAMYEAWGEEYGVVYQVPTVLGQSRIILADPRAIAHFYARETWTSDSEGGYSGQEGEKHRRQRKSLTPAFSNNAIRGLTSVFYDSAYKVKGAWDALIGTGGNDSAVIEVQSWMNHVSLDTIGIAGFSHDFGSLDGKPASVTEIFDAFGSSIQRRSQLHLIDRLSDSMGEISTVLLNRTRKEKELGIEDDKGEKSVIGLLIKAESENAELYLSDEEVVAQFFSV